MASQLQPTQFLHLINQPTDEIRRLLEVLGIITPPAPWALSNVVSPVSIVDSRITLTAQTSREIWDSRHSAGELVNPAANTRWFDTGQLPAGTYSVQIEVGCRGAIQQRIKQRNAADAADVNQMLKSTDAAAPAYSVSGIWKLAANERIVMENNAAPGAGVLCQGVCFVKLLV